jgi:Fe-S-cluster containining protein
VSHRRLPMVRTTAAEAMGAAYERLDERMRQRVRQTESTEGALSPCRKGCAHCCRQPALLQFYELAVLVEAIRALPRAQRDRIRGRLTQWTGELAKLSHYPVAAPDGAGEYMRAGIVCPLLNPADESCLVYAARPLVCRMHQVVGSDPAACRDPAATLPFVRAVDLGYEALREFRADYGGTPDPLAVSWALLPELLGRAWSLIESTETDFEAWCTTYLFSRRAACGSGP